MLVGALTHIKWIFENGIFSQQINTPFFSTIFWDSLAFLDIIAAILLIYRPKDGILLTLLIITIDLIHNNIVVLLDNEHMNEIGVKMWATKYWMLIVQLLFMTFVFATIKSNLKEINCKLTFKNDNNENKANY
jgi:hypothetical protein